MSKVTSILFDLLIGLCIVKILCDIQYNFTQINTMQEYQILALEQVKILQKGCLK
jgi:hypothetical protein